MGVGGIRVKIWGHMYFMPNLNNIQKKNDCQKNIKKILHRDTLLPSGMKYTLRPILIPTKYTHKNS